MRSLNYLKSCAIMPFTASHIAAIIPLCWFKKFSISALAIGSMIPDFILFYPISAYSFTHSILGLPLFCLPIGLMVYLYFEHIGKYFCIDVLPRYIQRRLQHYRQPATSHNWLMIACSLLIGASTHVFWDGFTHSTGWAINLLPILNEPVEVLSASIPMHGFLQHISSVIGLIVVSLIAMIVLYRQPFTQDTHALPLMIRMVITCSFLLIPLCVLAFHWINGSNLISALTQMVIDTLTIGISLLFAYSLGYWLYLKNAKTESTKPLAQ